MLDSLRKAVSLLDPAERRQAAGLLAMITSMAALESLGVLSVMPFLAVLGNPGLIDNNPWLAKAYVLSGAIGHDDFLARLGLACFMFFVASAGLRAFTYSRMNHFVELLRHSLSLRLLGIYLSQPYEFFVSRHSSDLSKTILSEVDQAVQRVLRPVMSMAAHTFVLAALAAVLVWANPLLAAFTLCLMGGLYLAIYVLLRRRILGLGKRAVASNRLRFEAAAEGLAGIKEIKVLGKEEVYLKRFESNSRIYAEAQSASQAASQVPTHVVEALAIGSVLAITVWMLRSAESGASGIGEILPLLGLYTFSAYRMKPALSAIYNGMSQLRFGAAAIDALHLDLALETRGDDDALVRPDSAWAFPARITLASVSFRYQTSDRDSLSDIDLQISAGSSVGFVGSTGSGKTTLVDVILGLLKPTSGTVLIDGHPLEDGNLRDWQLALGYVPQQIFLADASVLENIALGVPPEDIDVAHAKACARAAQIHDFVESELADGYNTRLGERGIRLSGGQRQRIGIARALYREPAVLVLDEATSALDAPTEAAVMSGIHALPGQRTLITIAHRLATVRQCDKIFMLRRGRVVCSGTYDKLARENADFRRLAAAT